MPLLPVNCEKCNSNEKAGLYVSKKPGAELVSNDKCTFLSICPCEVSLIIQYNGIAFGSYCYHFTNLIFEQVSTMQAAYLLFRLTRIILALLPIMLMALN